MKYYKKNAALLQSDLWIICDGPVHQSGKQIYFGVGDTNLDLTVYASKDPTQWTLWKLGTKSCKC
jgi:hypothetical protein